MNRKEFFGSKLNTVLLLVLIALILLTLKLLLVNKELFFSPPLDKAVGYPPVIVSPEILGNKDDLVSFSILPGSKVHGVLSYRGVIKGAYFFEANILINILDTNKKVLKSSNAMATTEWMTSGPVSFEGNIDFSGLPKGPAYFEIHNDNPSDMREYDKSVLIPIIIE